MKARRCNERGRPGPSTRGPNEEISSRALHALTVGRALVIFIHDMNSSSSSVRATQRLKDRFKEETVRSVLAAAEEVFAAQGVHAASMAQIAERAGVAVGTLYNHFKDRDALVRALIDLRHSEMFEKLDARRAEVVKEPFRLQLDAFLQALVDHFEAHGSFFRIIFMSEYKNAKDQADTMTKLYERFQGLMRVGHKEKLLRADPDDVFPGMLLGAVRSVLMRDLYGARPLSPATRVSSIRDFFLRGAGR